ncbi:TonB-dependent receptor [Chitinophaga sp. SYP-B3965]|uniref:TonB-dependent receptor n=1 Tax=Chitinophaga sp. SYP-B3965 TaxID=2663120 RepID=UPI001566CF8F
MKKYLLLLFILISVVQISLAQNGKVEGKVLSSRNEPLIGVSVRVVGLSSGATTDVEGRFVITLPAGKKYSLTLSYLGYTTKTVADVNIVKDAVEHLDVVLEDNNNQLKGVTIQGTSSNAQRETTNSLVTLQRNSTAVASVLAADFIRRTPDKNTGEVLKRVSGASIKDNKFVIVRGLSDRYNAAFLNNAQMPSSEPDKKVFTFDVIPSVLIDNIVINKTATPDLTGEFAGGIVQIQTKDLPSKKIFNISVSLGYNTQSTFKDFTSNQRNNLDWLGFDNGTRRLPAGFPENRQQYAGKPDVTKAEYTHLFKSDVYKEVKKTAAPIQSYALTYANTIDLKGGAKFGTVVGLIYRQSQNIFPDTERSRYYADRSNTDNEYIFKYREDQNVYNVNWGALANFTYLKGRHKISFKNLFNRNFEDKYVTRTGTNENNNANVMFNSSFLNQRSLYSTQLEGVHQLTTSGVRFTWNLNGSMNYKTQPDYRVVEYRTPLENPTATPVLNDDETRRFFSELQDYSAGFNASLLIPFKLFDEKQSLKIGGSSLLRLRNFEARNFQYTGSQEALLKPINQIFQPENIGADKIFLNEVTQNTDKYFGISVVDGMYLMFDNKITDNLRAIWGVRAEYFQQFLRTRDLSAENVIVNTEKWDFLPSLNLTYSLNTKNQLRLAGSMTVARPEFREIAPFAFFDYDAIYGVSGNPALERTQIYNADLRYEYYPKPGEAFSFGLFYKDFRNPIEFIMNPASNADRQNYEYANAVKAVTYGAEVEIRKELFKNVSVFSNLTYSFSKVTFNNVSAGGKEESTSRPLQGQSPYLFNVGFQYTNVKTGLSSSILYNKIGPRLALVGSPPPGAGFYDVYDKSRDLVDFQIAKRIIKSRGEIKLTVSDILNQSITQYDNIGEKEGYNRAHGDRFTNSYKPGTTFTIGFTYDFIK